MWQVLFIRVDFRIMKLGICAIVHGTTNVIKSPPNSQKIRLPLMSKLEIEKTLVKFSP